jgi:hypothetical protein
MRLHGGLIRKFLDPFEYWHTRPLSFLSWLFVIECPFWRVYLLGEKRPFHGTFLTFPYCLPVFVSKKSTERTWIPPLYIF